MSDPWLRALIAAPFGLAIGSFMTVVAARVPTGESLVRPRSKCPSCGTQIRARDNVPLLGWVLLRGRCRACGSRISSAYPLLEFGTAVLFAGAFYAYASPWVAVGISLLLALLPAIAVIDIRHKIIPNRLVYPALIIFPAYLVVARLAGAPVDLVGMVLGFLAYGGGMLLVALLYPRGMDMGDVKLAAVIGIVLGSLGLSLVAVAAMLGFFLGAVVGVAIMAFGGKGRKSAVPFGPFLAAGAVLSVFFGTQIADWYLNLLG